MINRIKSLLAGPASAQPGPDEPDGLQLAAAALLVEAARLDGEFVGEERDVICAVIGSHFGLSSDESETLIVEAEAAQDEASDLHRFTRTLNRRYAHEERLQVMEMLWEVVYADGRLHAYEANLVRRIGGLLHITDRERGDARKRVLARRERAAAGTTAPQQSE